MVLRLCLGSNAHNMGVAIQLVEIPSSGKNVVIVGCLLRSLPVINTGNDMIMNTTNPSK